MTRTQEIAIFTNPDGSTGYRAVGLETPEEITNRLQKEGKHDIMVFVVPILYWSH